MLERSYRQALAEGGRVDRAEAIGAALARGHAGRAAGVRELVFIGVADLNARQRAIADVWGYWTQAAYRLRYLFPDRTGLRGLANRRMRSSESAR